MDFIIFHKSCPDGFCAAKVAKMKYPEAELMPKDHGTPPPIEEVKDKDVLVVDFSWRTRDDNIAMARSAKSFHIFDHHKTALAELTGLPFATFDMERSGAGLTWDYLFPEKTRPWYVSYVEDRDLWRHNLPLTKEINSFIMTLPFKIESWNVLDTMEAEEAAKLGTGALAHVEHYVREAVPQHQKGFYHDVDSGLSLTVAIVNALYMNISEVGNELAKLADIGVGWFERGDGIMQFSLRSIGDRDVSKIAKRFGGGGHRNAAGFQLPIIEGRKLVDGILGRV